MLKKAYFPKQQDISSRAIIEEMPGDTRDVKNSAPHHTAVNIADLHDNAHSVVHSDTHTTTVEVEKLDDTQYTEPGDTYSAVIKIEDPNNTLGMERSETCSAAVNVEEPHNTQGGECSDSGHTTSVEIINICSVCGKGFSTLSDVKTHMISHTEAMPNYLIKFCNSYDIVYPPTVEEPHNTQDMKRGGTGHPAVKIINMCSVCGKRFSTLSDIKTHMTTHTRAVPNKSSTSSNKICKDDTIVCPPGVMTKEQSGGVRDTVMMSPSTLQIVAGYVTDTMSENDPGLTDTDVNITPTMAEKQDKSDNSPECDQDFLSHVTDLNTHSQTHDGEKLTSFDCGDMSSQVCNINTHRATVGTLSVHAVGINTEVQEGTPTIQTKTTEQLNSGMQRIDLSTEKTCVKSNSGMGFTASGNISTSSRASRKEPFHVCSDCGKVFSTALALTIHKKIHIEEKTYVCSDCGERFSQEGSFKEHMMNHRAVRLHICPDCGQEFTRVLQLLQHMGTHTGENPHMCLHCGEGFSDPGSLKAHMKTHTGEKHDANDSHPILVCEGQTDNDTQDVKNSAPHRTAVNIADLHDNAHNVVHSDTHTTRVEVKKPGDTQYTEPGDIYSAAIKIEDPHNTPGMERSETCSAPVKVEVPHNTQSTERGGVVFGTVNIEELHNIQGTECSGKCSPAVNIEELHNTQSTESSGMFFGTVNIEDPHNIQATQHSGSGRTSPVQIINISSVCGKEFSTLSDVKTHMTTHTGAVSNTSSNNLIKFCKHDPIVCLPGVNTKEQGGGVQDTVMMSCSTLQTVAGQVTDMMSENGPGLTDTHVDITLAMTEKQDKLDNSPECDQVFFNHVTDLNTNSQTHDGEKLTSSDCGDMSSEACNINAHTATLGMSSVHAVGIKTEMQEGTHTLQTKTTEQFNTGIMKIDLSTEKTCVKLNSGMGFTASGKISTGSIACRKGPFYICSDCAKVFSTKLALKIHKKIHIEETTSKHSGSSHTPVKIIQICSVCGKGFNSLRAIEIHMIIHTGAMPNKSSPCFIKVCKGYNIVYPPEIKIKKKGGGARVTVMSTLQTVTGQVTDMSENCIKPSKNDKLNLQNNVKTHTGLIVNHYACSKCSKTFFEKESLQMHTGMDGKEEILFVCTQCGKEFGRPGQLNKHMLTHMDEEFRFCSHCGKGFRHFNNLNPHMKIQKGEMPHVCSACICPVCGKSFRQDFTQEKKKLHMLTHIQWKRYLCSNCGKQFKNLNSLKTHMLAHTGAKADECTVCAKDFSTSGALKTHMMTKIGAKPPVCNHCGKRLSTLGALKTHMRLHTGEKPHVCEYCNKAFVQLISLKLHLMSHTGKRPHVCSHCHKGFCTKQVLKLHMRKHTGEKPYVCSECGKAFGIKQRLQQHIRMHTGEAPYLCSHCGKVFETKQQLQKHTRMHTGEKPYLCPHCGKRYNSEPSLTTHIRQHTGEKPYLCSHCSKQFSDRTSLKYHMMHHTGKWAHVCSDCGKGFSQKGGLKYHMTTHTGEKHHVCADCGKGFSTNQNLKIHMRSHTGVKSHTCSDCGKGFSQLDSLTKHMEIHEAEKD